MAEVVELHEVVMRGDVMQMQQIAGGIPVAAKGATELKPGGYHIMLIGLKQDLKVGDKVKVNLTFEKAGPQVVEAEVK